MKLILMRGLPGSGKTTLARKLAEQENAVIFATDDFWMVDGRYCFDPTKLPDAHNWNIVRTEEVLKKDQSVVVDNCNTKRVYMQPYLDLAARYKATVEYHVAPLNDHPIDYLFYNNSHQVPFHIIEKMRLEWEEVS